MAGGRAIGAARPARGAAALLGAVVIALTGCGSGDETPSPSPVPSAPVSSPAGTASAFIPAAPARSADSPEDLLADLTRGSLVPFMVRGQVSAGGQFWTIPPTFFAQDLTVAEPVPVLTQCSVFGSSQPTVLVAHQETPDQSQGDYISAAFDGEIVTGGGYSHGSGEEWAWSVDQAQVSQAVALDGFLAVDLSWAGEAGENFTAVRSGVVGSVTCLLAPADVVDRLIGDAEAQLSLEAELAAQRNQAIAEAYDWPSKIPPPPGEPEHRQVVVFEGGAAEHAVYPPERYDEIVKHYTDAYGRPPDNVMEGNPPLAGAQWSTDSLGPKPSTTSVTRTDSAVTVTDYWSAP